MRQGTADLMRIVGNKFLKQNHKNNPAAVKSLGRIVLLEYKMS